jgi:hypothetical protein
MLGGWDPDLPAPMPIVSLCWWCKQSIGEADMPSGWAHRDPALDMDHAARPMGTDLDRPMNQRRPATPGGKPLRPARRNRGRKS